MNRTCYAVTLARDISAEDTEALQRFYNIASFTIAKIRKGRKRLLDIRKQVESLDVTGEKNLEMVLCAEEGKAAGKPAEILQAVLDLTDEECLDLKMLKVWSKPVS